MTNDTPPVAPVEGSYTLMPTKLAEVLTALVPLAAAVLDHADAHCRAFPIATAPMEDVMLYDGNLEDAGWTQAYWCKNLMAFQSGGIKFDMSHMTHWRPLPPPPSNPPLPAVFVELGAALERLKEGR